MKIQLARRGSQDTLTSTEKYIKTVFAHITDKIWIKAVSSEQYDQLEHITVEYDRQANTVDVDFDNLIKHAISLRGNLNLVSLELPRRCIQVSGLQHLENQNGVNAYKVLPIFAHRLVSKPEVCAKLSNGKITEIKFEFEETGIEGEYTDTGRVLNYLNTEATSLSNAYNRYARIVLNNKEICERIQSGTNDTMIFFDNPNGTSKIAFHESVQQQTGPTPTPTTMGK